MICVLVHMSLGLKHILLLNNTFCRSVRVRYLEKSEKVSDPLLCESFMRSLHDGILCHPNRSGYEAAAKHFVPNDLDVNLTGRSFMVTGANSGIGKAAAQEIAARG